MMPQTGNIPISVLTYLSKINECGITWHRLRLWGDSTDCNTNLKHVQFLKAPMPVLCQLFFSHTLVCLTHTPVLWFEKANIDTLMPQ